MIRELISHKCDVSYFDTFCSNFHFLNSARCTNIMYSELIIEERKWEEPASYLLAANSKYTVETKFTHSVRLYNYTSRDAEMFPLA